MSAPRHRLPLAPEGPAARRAALGPSEPASRLVLDRPVIAVTGDDALVSDFASLLRERASDGCAVIDPDTFVGDEAPEEALRARLDALPRGAWVIAAGEAAARRIEATFRIGLGKRHASAAETTDLWLGQSSAVVADALVEALVDARRGEALRAAI